jgi:hypothetical protein
MFCILNILFYHPVSEATPNSKITGAYCTEVRVLKVAQLGCSVAYILLRSSVENSVAKQGTA